MQFQKKVVIVAILSLLTCGCIKKIMKQRNAVDPGLAYSSSLDLAYPIKGYKRANFNLIKYAHNEPNKVKYKIQVTASGGESPGFKKGESITIVLNQDQRIQLTSLDGEVTITHHKDWPLKAVYYPITERELRQIIHSNFLEFYAYGYKFDVAGKLSFKDIQVFQKMYARG